MKHTPRSRPFVKALAVGATALVALSLAACSSGGAAAPTAEATAAGKTDIRIVVAPIQYETAYIAQQQGYFEEAGLNVEIVPGADPAANLAQAVSGAVDLTIISWGVATTSIAQGLPVQVVAGNGLVDPTRDNSGIMVRPDSPIQTVADLEGKTVGVQGVKSGGDIPLFQALEAAGVDWTSVNEVSIPYSGMQAALEQGTVDAVLPADSFYNQMVAAGFRSIANPTREFQANMPVTVWAATTPWLEANPGTAEKFVAAMSQAVDFYNDPANTDALHAIVAEVKQISAEDAAKAKFVPMQVELNLAEGQAGVDAYETFGLIPGPLTTDEMLWVNAPTK